MGTKTISKGHVGMLVHGYYPGDLRVRREAEALAEAGYRVDVICLRDLELWGKHREPHQDKINGVYKYRLSLTRKRGKKFRYIFEYMGLIILGAWKLTLLHLKKPFQVVHIHNMPDLLILAGLIPKWMGAKLLLDVHDPMVELYTSNYRIDQKSWVLKILNWQEKFSRKLANRIISVNETMRENLESKGIYAEKIFIVHNFPDTKYLPIKKDINNWTPPRSELILLYAGTITRQYRLDVAIRALASVLKEIPCVRMRIVGGGNEVNQVLRLADDLGIKQYVEYLKPVNIDKIKDIMKDADVGISCHQGGLFGDLQFTAKILDYITQGLPVVSSRTKTLMRYIPEEAVFYFEPENAEDMAEQIIKIWKSPDLVRKRMANAKKLFPQYTWQTEKSKLINFYQELLK